MLAGQQVPINDSFTVQATPATQDAATFSTFALRAAPAALADDGSSTALPQPPGATFVVTEDAVDVEGHPAGAVITEKYAYVLNYEAAGGVTVIDADPASPTYNQIVTPLPTGSSPALATLAGDRVYVVNNGLFDGSPATVTVINTNDNTVVDNFPIERYSFTPTATPQGDRVYVTNVLNNGVYVIDSDPASPTYNTILDMDPSTPEIDAIHLTPADAGPGTYQITAGTFNADGTRLYVARNHYEPTDSGTDITGDVVVIDTDPNSATYNQVLDLDASTPDTVDAIKAPGYVSGFGTTANGRLYEPEYDLVAAQQDPQNAPKGNVAVIDIDPNSPTYNRVIDVDPTTPEIDQIPVGRYPVNMAASPDGSVAYVINAADGTVTAIDTVTNKEITHFVYDSTPVDLTDPASAGPNLLAMSPDGKQIYITKYGDGTVTAVSIVPTV